MATMRSSSREPPLDKKASEKKKEIKRRLRQAVKENPLFKEFLKEEGIEGRFIKSATQEALRREKFLGVQRSITAISARSGVYAIEDTMTWVYTAEGHSYWNRKNARLQEFIRKKSQ